jgi:GntR family transcriptional regulator, vanillate catabolism transcriptional regulator
MPKRLDGVDSDESLMDALAGSACRSARHMGEHRVSEQENLSIQTVAAETNSQITRTVLRLREMILSGAFSPGERVSEAPLTGRLGASRTPIRLALERLAHEGLLDPYPTGGFIVRTFTLDDIWDGIEVRGVLEGAAARLAAERLTGDGELNALRRCQDEMDALGEPTPETLPQYLERNDRFHDEILRLAKSVTLKRSLERLLSMPLASRQALVSLRMRFPEATDIFVVGRDQHLRIIEAIAKRQGTRAENIGREHAEITRRALEFALAHAHELSALPGGKLVQM